MRMGVGKWLTLTAVAHAVAYRVQSGAVGVELCFDMLCQSESLNSPQFNASVERNSSSASIVYKAMFRHRTIIIIKHHFHVSFLQSCKFSLNQIDFIWLCKASSKLWFKQLIGKLRLLSSFYGLGSKYVFQRI